MAYAHCKVHVIAALKAPASADFPWGASTAGHKENLYSLHSYVDAQNSFGAKLRRNFACSIKYNGGSSTDINNWTLVNLQFEE
jgi:hypothetical protein